MKLRNGLICLGLLLVSTNVIGATTATVRVNALNYQEAMVCECIAANPEGEWDSSGFVVPPISNEEHIFKWFNVEKRDDVEEKCILYGYSSWTRGAKYSEFYIKRDKYGYPKSISGISLNPHFYVRQVSPTYLEIYTDWAGDEANKKFK